MKLKKMLITLILLNILFLSLNAKKTKFTSIPVSSKIVIDGKSNDWENIDATIWNDNIYVAFQHDNNYLYGLIITGDQSIKRQILFRGMTLWFDTKGKSKKEIGIGYPLGIRPNQTNNKSFNPSDFQKMRSEEQFTKALENIGNEVELFLGKKKIPHKKKITEIAGMEIKISESQGLLVYEIKIPCTEKSPFMFSVFPKKKNLLGFGLTIGRDIDIKRPPNAGGTGMSSGMGNMKGGRRQGGASGKRPEGINRQEKINLWGIIEIPK